MCEFVHESVQVSGRVGHLDSNILHFTCDSLSEHLKTLDSLCFITCSEYRDLKKAVNVYEKSKGQTKPTAAK